MRSLPRVSAPTPDRGAANRATPGGRGAGGWARLGAWTRPAGLVAALLVLPLLTGFREPRQETFGGVGSRAPEAALVDLDGNPRTLWTETSGWSLLKLATTWCPRCDDTVRELNALGAFFRDRGIRVVEVYLRDSPGSIREELRDRPREYPGAILLDRGGDTVALYKVTEIPRLLLLGQDRTVLLDTTYLPAPQLRSRIEAMLPAPGSP